MCKTQGAECSSAESGGVLRIFQCKRCGIFHSPIVLTGILDKIGSSKERMLLSSWLRENSSELNPVTISRDFFNELNAESNSDAYRFKNMRMPNVSEKLNKLLLYLGENSEYLGFNLVDNMNSTEGTLSAQAISWAVNKKEFTELLDALKEMSFIQLEYVETGRGVGTSHLELTVNGW